MKDDNKVTILMATYNGEHYIKYQLDSLINQTYTNWQLIIRDDGSTDKTVDIIQGYLTQYKNISLTVNQTYSRGACKNFSALFDLALKDTSIEYLMFCDQDDIWKPTKIETSLTAILTIESEMGLRPLLAYGDLEIMDDDGSFVPGAFKIKHAISLKNILSYNYVFGCTIILNRLLMEKIKSIPPEAVNHDYWIALVASGYKTIFIPEKTIRYRQHSNNASLNYKGNKTLPERLKRLVLAPDKEINYMVGKLKMFNSFYNIYQNELSSDDKSVLHEYLESFNNNRFQVCYIMVKNRMFRKGFFQTMASFFQIIFFFKNISTKNS